MDEKERDEILYRLDERTKRVDDHLDRLDKRLEVLENEVEVHDERIADNEDWIQTANKAATYGGSTVLAGISALLARLAGFIKIG